MKIFALSDLHLSLSEPYRAGDAHQPSLSKPMLKFGALWQDYFQRLERNWYATVSDEDTVLIAGDISWAMTLAQAEYDLAYIDSLPGRKLMVKGNHDYWWESVSRLRSVLPPSIAVLQHEAVVVGNYAVCGTRGWVLPEHSDFRESSDRKIFDRELIRMELALEQAASFGLPVIAMMHYPPLDNADIGGQFCELMGRYAVTDCVYGHIHGDKKGAYEGEYKGIRYHNCSIDRIDFCPRLIVEQ